MRLLVSATVGTSSRHMRDFLGLRHLAPNGSCKRGVTALDIIGRRHTVLLISIRTLFTQAPFQVVCSEESPACAMPTAHSDGSILP